METKTLTENQLALLLKLASAGQQLDDELPIEHLFLYFTVGRTCLYERLTVHEAVLIIDYLLLELGI